MHASGIHIDLDSKTDLVSVVLDGRNVNTIFEWQRQKTVTFFRPGNNELVKKYQKPWKPRIEVNSETHERSDRETGNEITGARCVVQTDAARSRSRLPQKTAIHYALPIKKRTTRIQSTVRLRGFVTQARRIGICSWDATTTRSKIGRRTVERYQSREVTHEIFIEI